MKQIKNGFTLIELLGVIVLVGLVTAVTIPSVMTIIEGGKRKEYELLKEDILVAAKTYTTEYSDSITWQNNGNTSSTLISLDSLVDTGILKSLDGRVENPVNGKNLKSCMSVTATKNNTTYKITYVLNNNCDA